jgi:hypothetical protein
MRGARRGPSPWWNFFEFSFTTAPAVVVQRAHDWASWIIPKVEKFPKAHRFSIAQRLVAASIELLMSLVDDSYQARNAGSLTVPLVP